MKMIMMIKGSLWRFIENGELTQPGMIPALLTKSGGRLFQSLAVLG